jgi:hypothetical protein
MARDKVPFKLMPGEELLLMTKPHPLAMLGLMFFWLFIGALGVAFKVYYPDIIVYFKHASWSLLPDFMVQNAYDVVWAAALLLPLIIMAVFRINFGYVIVLLLLLAARGLIWWKAESQLGIKADAHLENYLLMAVGVIGVIGVELFRRGHRYYLTSMRIVARFGTLHTSERSTLYSKIDDLMLQKSFIGSFFNFGTVIPITATGLGMGQDMAIAGASAGAGKGPIGASLFAAGAKAKNVPRELSIYVLYRVKAPEHARNLILQEMHARERPRAKAQLKGDNSES